MRTMNDERQWVQHSLEVLRTNEYTLRLVTQMESLDRAYQLTGDDRFRRQFDSMLIEAQRGVRELENLTRDNATQQRLLAALGPLLQRRFDVIRALLAAERVGASAPTVGSSELVQQGAQIMAHVQELADSIEREENRLLRVRRMSEARAEKTTRLTVQYSFVLAVLLVGVVGLLTTRSIRRPIRALSDGAARIGSGDYSQTVEVLRDDELGQLALVFNDMAGKIASREQSLAEQDWLNVSLTRFSRLMEGQRDQARMCEVVLSEFAVLTGARHSVIYVPDETMYRHLKLQAAHAADNPPLTIVPGQGLIGQCYRDAAAVILDEVPKDYLRIGSGLGRSKPAQVVVMPAMFEGEVKAIIELATLTRFSNVQLTLLQRFCDSFATVLHGLATVRKTERLLSESRALSDQLREQQAEVQQSNAELEQVNEELQRSNVELEEKAAALEEQRKLIGAANLEVERARAALLEKMYQLEAISRYKSEFLANMSHELRTPLNGLMILSKILAENAEGTLTPKQVERANTIHSAGQDLLELINDILDLAKIESGTVMTESAQVRPAEIAQAMQQAFAHVADNAKIGFDSRVADDVPDTIVTDSRRLQQILRNLLSNAFKFTSKGGVELRIERVTSGWGESESLAAADAVIAFSVHDTGIGIPADRHDAVFEAFRQGDAGTARRYGGTGLGLSISRKLASLLHGALTLQSEQGKGSTFTLFVPRVLSEAAAPQQPAAIPQPSRSKTTAAPTAKLREPVLDETPSNEETAEDDRATLTPADRTLLIIEDDRTFGAVLADFAGDKGFKVIIERTAGDAVRSVRRFRPCAITLDLLLKDSNGWAVLDRLKNDPELCHIPVHVISVDDQRERALLQGAMSFLHKPVTRETLDKVLGDTLALIGTPVRRMLLVEDEPMQRAAVVDLIGSGDVEIVAVATAKEALAALDAGAFHCMVVDLGLPDMGGAELIEAMHRKFGQHSPPVIIYTGKPLTRAEETELRAVSEAVIIKGVNSPERLLHETALFLHRAQSRLPESKRRLLDLARKDDPVLRGRSVLVVDDDVRNIFAITAGLESHQMQVRYAESGAAAIELLQSQEQFDIVLMDLMMPEMDGFEAIRRIRQIEPLKTLPIIVLSAKAMTRARETCQEAGASDYLSKPVDLDQLRSMLRVWLYKD
jgi:signal transduction histidine kinase/DNA-binding response OmpR family regulator/CHASE3 domain sensor protein